MARECRDGKEWRQVKKSLPEICCFADIDSLQKYFYSAH